MSDSIELQPKPKPPGRVGSSGAIRRSFNPAVMMSIMHGKHIIVLSTACPCMSLWKMIWCILCALQETSKEPQRTQKKLKEKQKRQGISIARWSFKTEMISSLMTCQVGSLALSFTPLKNQSGAHEGARKMCLLSPGTVNILSICQRSVKGFLWECQRKPLQIPEGNAPLVFSLPPTKGRHENLNGTAD